MKRHRIVSLLPSATEIVHALGLGKCLVARSHECDYPAAAASLPIATHTSIDTQASSKAIDTQVRELLDRAMSPYGINYDLLVELYPTHIVTQDLCHACAIDPATLQDTLLNQFESQPQLISLNPTTLQGVFDSFHQLADALEYPTRAERVVEDCARRINHVRAVSADQVVRPRIACIEWLDPLMITGHWVPDLLQACDAETVLSPLGGKPSFKITLEQLRKADPDMILFMPCGFSLERTLKEATHLVQGAEWQRLTAIKIGNVYATDGSQFFNRPGPRLAESTEILASILYPDLFDFDYAGKAWAQVDTP